MTQFKRAFVREGDTTTTQGHVGAKPTAIPVMHHGRAAVFEGDPVWCPACDSHGVTRCVQPWRPNTGPDGRQASLDGDLCICRCAVPPRLVARQQNITMGFTIGELVGRPGIDGWLAHAGHATVAGFDEHFVLQDMAAGQPVTCGFSYGVASSSGTQQGTTDESGVTHKVHTAAPTPVRLLYAVQTQIGVRE
jgi:uncharacterized Zn-binding protein involved in type VI secretion